MLTSLWCTRVLSIVEIVQITSDIELSGSAAQQPLRPINWCSRLLKMTFWIHNCVSMRYCRLMSSKDVGLRIRVEKELREAFQAACLAETGRHRKCCASSCRHSPTDTKAACSRICSRHQQPGSHVNQPREKRYEPIQFFGNVRRGRGQALGLEMAGFDHAALVELEPAACATLRLNRPAWNVIEDDLRRFDGRPIKASTW